MIQTRAGLTSELDNAVSHPPRSPSRAGFMRPQLCRQRAFTSLDWADSSDSSDDDDNWEFASTLLIPFSPSTSDDSDLSDDYSDLETPETLSKPLVAKGPIAVVHASMDISIDDEVASTTSEDDEPYLSLAVTDHGHSRSALSHLKEFWHARFDEYARMEAQVIHNSAYGGIVEVNRSRDTLRALLLSRLSRVPNVRPPPPDTTRPRTPSANPNAPIYPRTGDLLSLHDSRSATLDRAFSNYPLYSINKILFLHDMLHRSTGSLTTSKSRATSPTSDSNSPTRRLPPHMDDTFVDISLSNSQSDSNSATLASAASPLCSFGDSTGTKFDDARDWEVDWTVRWQVLLDSTKEDSLCLRPSAFPSPAVDETAFYAALHPEQTKAPKFFFADEYDEFSGLDDDEDYGELVERPMFSLSAETLSREFLHTFNYQAAL